MKKSLPTAVFFLSFIIHFQVCSQSCECLVSEVKSNSVTPCEDVIGEVTIVNSAASFNQAIIQANNTGGNMTILIQDGIYTVASTSSFPYLTANNVVIRSQSGNRDAIILEGGGMQSTSSTEDGILVAGDNVTIADLTIREVGNHNGI